MSGKTLVISQFSKWDELNSLWRCPTFLQGRQENLAEHQAARRLANRAVFESSIEVSYDPWVRGGIMNGYHAGDVLQMALQERIPGEE